MGTKGTCKTALADGLASHLELMVPGSESEDDDENEEPASSCFKLSVAGGGLEVICCGILLSYSIITKCVCGYHLCCVNIFSGRLPQNLFGKKSLRR